MGLLKSVTWALTLLSFFCLGGSLVFFFVSRLKVVVESCVIPPSIVTNAELWTLTQVIQFVTFLSHIWRSRFTIERVSFFAMPKRSPLELPGILVSMLSNDRVSTNLPNCQFEKHANTCFPPTFWYNTHLLVLYIPWIYSLPRIPVTKIQGYSLGSP